MQAENLAQFLRGHVAQRFQKVAERPDVAEHPCRLSRHLPRVLSPRAVEFGHARNQTVAGKGEGGSAERVGGDQVTPGLPVSLMNPAHHLGALRVPEHPAFSSGEAFCKELGSHCAVANERPRG